MADEEKPARTTPAQRAQLKREEKLAAVKDEIESGRMTTRKLSPEELAEHQARRDEIQAERGKRKK